MRLLKNEKTATYHEIEVENSFLFMKWKTKYRKINDTVVRFKPPDNYYNIGLFERVDVGPLFDVIV